MGIGNSNTRTGSDVFGCRAALPVDQMKNVEFGSYLSSRSWAKIKKDPAKSKKLLDSFSLFLGSWSQT